MNIVIGFIWKYILMGLVFTIIYAVLLSLYICKKCNFDEDLIEECFDILAQMPGYGRFCKSKEFKKFFKKKTFPLAIAIWPINIANGLSRLPDIVDHINESTKKSGV